MNSEEGFFVCFSLTVDLSQENKNKSVHERVPQLVTRDYYQRKNKNGSAFVSLAALQFSINKPHCVCRGKQCLFWIRTLPLQSMLTLSLVFLQKKMLSKFINS